MQNDTSPPVDHELLDRYLAGEAMDRERAIVEQWLMQSPDARLLIEEVRRPGAFDDATIDGVQFDAVVVAGAIEQRVAVGQAGVAKGWQGQSANKLRSERRLGFGAHSLRRSGVVTTILGLIVVCTIAVPTLRQLLRRETPSVASHLYRAGRAQRAAITLIDGSRVVLAPETQLRYTVDQHGAIGIDLIGEAFFSVTHRTNQAFVVRTGTIMTKVLGTAFNVRRYPGDTETQVAVVDGRVAITGHSTLVLGAGRVVDVNDSTLVANTTTDVNQAAAWTQGHLIFNDAPVSDMLTTLGRWYGYTFRLTDTVLAKHHVSITFSLDRPADALNTLKTMLGVTMTFEGNTVTLWPKRRLRNGAIRDIRSRELFRSSDMEAGR